MKKLAFVLLVFTFSCTAPKATIENAGKNSHQDQAIIDGKIFATAYQQRAAEYRALCYQAFNTARYRVDQLKGRQTEKPMAIMTDIDETVLDNSPYEVHQLLQGKDYDDASWKEWTAKGAADTVPGALSFLQYASACGIEIFYVTNRGEEERVGTLANLKKFGFPYAVNEHLLLKNASSSKEERKKSIEQTHTIVLLMGDNLNDFSFLFEKKDPDERALAADRLSAEFGSRFIVLPNPVYGDWEFSLYHFNYGFTNAQKDSALKTSLKGY